MNQVAEQARPEDVAIVYMAGHGVGLGQQFYFLPHEMRKEADEQAAIRKYGRSRCFPLGMASWSILL